MLGNLKIKEVQIESFENLKPKKSLRMKEEVFKKEEIQAVEGGADIDELFMEVYGEPGQPISAEERMNIENTRSKRLQCSENTHDDKVVDKRRNSASKMVMIDEDIIKKDCVNLEEAEIDWDDLFESTENSVWSVGFLIPCSVV